MRRCRRPSTIRSARAGSRSSSRDAALVRLEIGGERVTYLVQRARGVAPPRSERNDGELRAVAWRRGPYTCVAVGPDASVATWRAAFH